MKDYGASLTWPEPPRALKETARKFESMFSRWRIWDPNLLKGGVGTSMAVLPQALKIDELLNRLCLLRKLYEVLPDSEQAQRDRQRDERSSHELPGLSRNQNEAK